MNKKLLFLNLTLVILASQLGFSQNFPNKKNKPKLVVGIIVDQMRYDYLTRFSDRYGEEGFKKIVNEGFSLENTHYNYIPTYTAVGHASIFTGTTPVNHGIIGNTWYNKYLKKEIYCVTDNNEKTIGNYGKNGKKSPRRLLTTTIADQLHLDQNMKGKTIGIAIKDRSSILPVGHSANAAYWFDGGDEGKWITSSYYMQKLPKWVEKFNKSDKADKYINSKWETLHDISTYKDSRDDNNEYEETFKGKAEPTFPYDIAKLNKKNKKYNILKSIPAGNTFTTDFAISCIKNEKLGKNEHTDLLTISYSSTDYIGHQFGSNSKEIEDTYLRLDKDLAQLLKYLDKNIGKENYTLFLTADHAVLPIPSYLQANKIPGHYFDKKDFLKFCNRLTLKHFKTNEIIENISNFQIFLNHEKIEELGLKSAEITELLVDKIINYNAIQKVVSSKTLQKTNFGSGILNILQNGYNQKRSGDILIIPNPGTLESTNRKGTSHGSGYSYDTHVPLIFYGKGINKGISKKKYVITQIAPTISNLLQIESPNGTTGTIIEEVLKK